MTDAYDARDRELGIPDRLARIVAEVVSGLSDAEPTDDDYMIAAYLRRKIDEATE